MKDLYISRKLILIWIVCQFSLPAMAQAAGASKELVLYTWEEYMDPEVVKAFETSFQAKLKQVYYDSDDARDEQLLQTKGKGYDIVVAMGQRVAPYVKHGWIIPVNESNIPNLKHISPRWRKAYEQTEQYGVPFMWGTTGIVYRKDLVKAPITSWQQFYRPADSLKGKIMVLDDHRVAIGFALKALGYSYNSVDTKALSEVEKMLLEMKPFIQAMGFPRLDETSGIVTGTTWIAHTWNGDALTLQQFNQEITYVIPKEGGQLWNDYLLVMQHAPQKKLALDFVNFLHEPQNAAKLSLYTLYATTNKSAEKFLPPEHLNNAVIYPSQSVIDRSEFEQNLPPRIHKKYNAIHAKLIQ